MDLLCQKCLDQDGELTGAEVCVNHFLTTEQISLNISSSAEQEGIHKLNIIAWKEETFPIFALLLSFKRTPMNLTITNHTEQTWAIHKKNAFDC